MTVNKLTKVILSSLLMASAGTASAAAFQLAEVSTTGLGRAYAGEAAIADNASVVATNPALMAKFKQAEVSVGSIYVDPSIDVSGKLSSFDASHKNIAPNALVPNIYAVYPINDKFAIGGGINVNYGLATKFDKNYDAGFLGGKTDLKTVNLNLSGSYRVSDSFSVGLGLNAVYAKAELERYAGKLPALIKAQATARQNGASSTSAGGSTASPSGSANPLSALDNIPANAVISRLTGNKLGFGWNIGLVYEFNENNRIGLAYHSQVKLNFKGKYSNQLPNTATTVLASAKIIPTDSKEIAGSLSLPLPAYLEISGYHKMTDRFAMHYSYKYTQWSKFKELRATSQDGKTLFSKQEQFRDSSRIALGATYDVNDKLTLRTGIAYDETAASDHHSISIPDTDRVWYSVGATYRFTPNLSVDAGFSHLQGKKNTFVEDGVKFTVKAKANLYGLNLNYRF
ncbi:hypothetical protein GVX81_03625 [[Haemophilus] felis]|uniref:Outer membrane protein P1 n=1 Tax=[Haemophilus] felis TaxID=123822 RepID=A0A1T0AWD7_9PAST|nr:hypothetical protein [[Haemophilus] felis]NBI41366.1 hypothetical protein [[Haemophilus] felis]OOS01893.1 hypothetical protein B0188_09455 [[Haemophilus] felis]